MRHLLPEPTKLEKTITRTKKQLTNLDATNANMINGKHMYVQDLNATAKTFQLTGRTVADGVQRRIIKSPGKVWKSVSNERKVDYHARALAYRQELNQARGKLCSSVRNRLKEVEAKHEENVQPYNRLRFASVNGCSMIWRCALRC